MLEQKETFVELTTPEVIEERNRLVAARIGKELGYGAEKMQKLLNEINSFSHDPRQMIEVMYKKLWPLKNTFSRDEIQKIINKCHVEAFEAAQLVHLSLLG